MLGLIAHRRATSPSKEEVSRKAKAKKKTCETGAQQKHVVRSFNKAPNKKYNSAFFYPKNGPACHHHHVHEKENGETNPCPNLGGGRIKKANDGVSMYKAAKPSSCGKPQREENDDLVKDLALICETPQTSTNQDENVLEIPKQRIDRETVSPTPKNTTSSMLDGVGGADSCNKDAPQHLSVNEKGISTCSFYSLFWICVAMLLHMTSQTVVNAVCAPVGEYQSRDDFSSMDSAVTDLEKAVNACLDETDSSLEFTLEIKTSDITEDAGVSISQVLTGAKGTLTTALTGATMTVVIECASGPQFTTSGDLTVGSTLISFQNMGQLAVTGRHRLSTGICPLFAAASNSDGCNNGGVNGIMGDWDVSGVCDMYELFDSKSSFNADISKWITSSVISMTHSRCFFCLLLFYRKVYYIYTRSNIISLSYDSFRSLFFFIVFANCPKFNSDVSKWDTKSVTSFKASKCLTLTLFVCRIIQNILNIYTILYI